MSEFKLEKDRRKSKQILFDKYSADLNGQCVKKPIHSYVQHIHLPHRHDVSLNNPSGILCYRIDDHFPVDNTTLRAYCQQSSDVGNLNSFPSSKPSIVCHFLDRRLCRSVYMPGVKNEIEKIVKLTSKLLSNWKRIPFCMVRLRGNQFCMVLVVFVHQIPLDPNSRPVNSTHRSDRNQNGDIRREWRIPRCLVDLHKVLHPTGKHGNTREKKKLKISINLVLSWTQPDVLNNFLYETNRRRYQDL